MVLSKFPNPKRIERSQANKSSSSGWVCMKIFIFGWLTSIRDPQGPPDQRGYLLVSFHHDIFQALLNDRQPWPLPSQFCSLVHKINNPHWDYFANELWNRPLQPTLEKILKHNFFILILVSKIENVVDGSTGRRTTSQKNWANFFSQLKIFGRLFQKDPNTRVFNICSILFTSHDLASWNYKRSKTYGSLKHIYF
jgi:hypothetical protein